MASVIVIWRFTGTRLASPTSERRAQRLVAVSFFLLAPYIAFEATRALVTADRAETSIVGLVLTGGTAIFEPALGVAKRRIGVRFGSSATAGEGTQNLLCAYLAMAVFAGLAANTLFGAWWLDGVVALAIAGWAVAEGRRVWAGRSCGCAASQQPAAVIVAAAEPGHHAGAAGAARCAMLRRRRWRPRSRRRPGRPPTTPGWRRRAVHRRHRPPRPMVAGDRSSRLSGLT
jgi:hypothetical protein